MLSLLLLAGALFFVLDRSGAALLSLFLLPLIVFLAYIAGPQDVLVDLETRMCHETAGWIIYPQKRNLALTEASCLCIFANGASYYVTLMIGGGTKRYFIIARPITLRQARIIAEPIAEKLHLPVNEVSVKEMIRLS